MDGESELLSVAGLAYEAATGERGWHDFGAALRRLTDARSASLWVGDPVAGEVEILVTENLPDACRAAYAAHYVHTDLWTQALAGGAPGTYRGTDLVPEATLRASEFYNDFARPLGLFHLIGHVGRLGGGVVMPLGLHRPETAEPFGERELRRLAALTPHILRACSIRRRLGPLPHPAAAALDALAVPAVVVDGGLAIRHANAMAERLAGSGAFPAFQREPGGAVQLAPLLRHEARALAGLAARVAAGVTPGGGMRLAGPGTARVLVTLTPLGRRSGLVLVLMRDAASPPGPAPEIVCQLFELSPAEAAVALALASGRTAPEVARSRGVSLATVRTQARAALEKAGASNLRELGRLFGAIPSP